MDAGFASDSIDNGSFLENVDLRNMKICVEAAFAVGTTPSGGSYRDPPNKVFLPAANGRLDDDS
jgi:hypothetical protein